MTTPAQLIAEAQSQLNYEETGGTGHNGNITKYWAELDPAFQGASWCGAFVDWVWKHAGHPYPDIDHPYGYTYCPNAVTYAKQHGLWSASGHYAPGDTVFYDWTGNSGAAEHTGIIVSDNGSVMQTIEGNTSPTSGGSQSNGGGVYAKSRPHDVYVLGVLRSSVWLAGQPAPTPARNSNPYPVPNGVFKQGATGVGVKFIQWAIGVPVDGIWGPQTNTAVRLFQSHYPACGGVDGVVGPKTIAVLRTITH